MSFLCPVANAAMSPLQASAHMGLMLGVVVAGLIFLAAGVIAYRRDDHQAERVAVRRRRE